MHTYHHGRTHWNNALGRLDSIGIRPPQTGAQDRTLVQSAPAKKPRPDLAITLSARARQLDLLTRGDVEREFEAAKFKWSRGTLYHCPFCDKDLYSVSGARKHAKVKDHPVLRWDWYEKDPSPRDG